MDSFHLKVLEGSFSGIIVLFKMNQNDYCFFYCVFLGCYYLLTLYKTYLGTRKAGLYLEIPSERIITLSLAVSKIR